MAILDDIRPAGHPPQGHGRVPPPNADSNTFRRTARSLLHFGEDPIAASESFVPEGVDVAIGSIRERMGEPRYIDWQISQQPLSAFRENIADEYTPEAQERVRRVPLIASAMYKGYGGPNVRGGGYAQPWTARLPRKQLNDVIKYPDPLFRQQGGYPDTLTVPPHVNVNRNPDWRSRQRTLRHELNHYLGIGDYDVPFGAYNARAEGLLPEIEALRPDDPYISTHPGMWGNPRSETQRDPDVELHAIVGDRGPSGIPEDLREYYPWYFSNERRVPPVPEVHNPLVDAMAKSLFGQYGE